MSIKTILTHLADDDLQEIRLEVGLSLAKRFKSHLSFLYCKSPVCMPIAIEGRGASASFLSYAKDTQHKSSEVLEAHVRDVCQKEKMSCTWHSESGNHLELLKEHSILKDLVIVSQDASQRKESQILVEIKDELPLLASCPVLVLPGHKPAKTLGQHVLLGWKWKPESFRALRDALPFLVEAEKVTVGLFSDQENPDEMVALNGYLKSHGVEATCVWNYQGERDPMKGLLALSEGCGADLLVMGAYGHSRLREIIFGGVTRIILENSKIPLLMSH